MMPDRLTAFSARWGNIIFNGHGTIELMLDLQSQLIYAFENFLTDPRYKTNRRNEAQHNHGE